MYKMDDFVGFPARMRKAMEAKTTIMAFTDKLGVSYKTLADWLKGKRFPNAYFLALICTELEVSPNYLMFGRETL